MSVSQMLASGGRFGKSYTLTRTAAGSYTLGRYTSGATTNPTAVVSLQPLSGRELQILPEQQHGEERQKFYTTTAMIVRSDSNEPDKITIGAELWQVISVADWPDFDGSRVYKVIIQRVVTTT